MRTTSAVLPRLPNHVLVRTQNANSLRETYAKIYAVPRLEVATENNLDAAVSQCQFHGLRIGYGLFGTATSWEFPNADCFLFLVPIEGAGVIRTRKRECDIVSGKPVMVSPAAGYIADYDASFATFSIKIEESLIRKRFETIAGAPLSTPLVFDPQLSLNAGVSRALQDYIRHLVDTIEQVGPILPEWWIEQTEQLVVMMLLCGQRHNYSHIFDRSPAEASMSQVRAAESYIEANIDRPITVDQLAEVSGVSMFSLYRSFKSVRGYSPMQFAERIRRGKKLFP